MDKKQEIDDNIQFEVLPEDHNGYDLSFKVIIIGDSGKYTFYHLSKLIISNKITNKYYSLNININFQVLESHA